MNGSLTKGGLIGAIGGAVGGITIGILSYENFWGQIGFITIDELTEVFGPPKIWTPETLLSMLIVMTTYNTFWGVILGLIYARTHEVIPGKGIVKGLVFAMMAYLIANIRPSQILTSFGLATVTKAIGFISNGFIYFVIFGLIVGALYKKGD